ncbi:MAG: YidH family protein [Roseiarcus sp.]
MIQRYSDHAANERTFLAWVRTAIATMAFGFLIERFDLFIRFASAELAGAGAAGGRAIAQNRNVANFAGVAFVLLGMAMIIIAALRFFRTARQIDASETTPGPGVRFDLALAALIVLLGCSLFLYLPQTVFGAR